VARQSYYLATSIDQGAVATLPGITSVAKSLGAASPSPAVFDMCMERQAARLVRSWRATDKQAVEACMRFADDHRRGRGGGGGLIYVFASR
jgi:L-serine/L-threonine ammonia-lyase